VRYHEAQQVVMLPFPFPYAQITVLAIGVYAFFLPFAAVGFGSWWGVSASITLLTLTFMFALELTAAELDMPFGEDKNDLPIMQMQLDMNRSLVGLTDVRLWNVPKLVECAQMTFEALVVEGNVHYDTSGCKYLEARSSIASQSHGRNSVTRVPTDGLDDAAAVFAVMADSNLTLRAAFDSIDEKFARKDEVMSEVSGTLSLATFDEESVKPETPALTVRTSPGGANKEKKNEKPAEVVAARSETDHDCTVPNDLLNRFEKQIASCISSLDDNLQRLLDVSTGAFERLADSHRECNAEHLSALEQLLERDRKPFLGTEASDKIVNSTPCIRGLPFVDRTSCLQRQGLNDRAVGAQPVARDRSRGLNRV